jgi:hypothetical protein
MVADLFFEPNVYEQNNHVQNIARNFSEHLVVFVLFNVRSQNIKPVFVWYVDYFLCAKRYMFLNDVFAFPNKLAVSTDVDTIIIRTLCDTRNVYNEIVSRQECGDVISDSVRETDRQILITDVDLFRVVNS